MKTGFCSIDEEGVIMNNAAIREISRTAMKLRNNYESQDLFDMALGDRVPKKDMILSVINDLQKITLPG